MVGRAGLVPVRGSSGSDRPGRCYGPGRAATGGTTAHIPTTPAGILSLLLGITGQLPQSDPSGTPRPLLDENAPRDVSDALELIRRTVSDLWTGFIERLPLIGLAVVIVLLGLVIGRYAEKASRRGLRRTRTDPIVTSLVVRLVRVTVVVVFLLLALSVAGVNVSAALALLGIAGVALALALQPALEGFIAGILLLVRKPFVAGDQISIQGVGETSLEGTVDDIDFRVTRLVDYDGERIIVPNSEVLRAPLVNLTRRGSRRTNVEFSVDYRDDHNAVPTLVRDAVRAVEGVHKQPDPRVLCTELGSSGVRFVVQYWTRPRRSEMMAVRDRVIRALKDAVEGAGMTIPWPIRTLFFDNPLPTERRAGGERGGAGGEPPGP